MFLAAHMNILECIEQERKNMKNGPMPLSLLHLNWAFYGIWIGPILASLLAVGLRQLQIGQPFAPWSDIDKAFFLSIVGGIFCVGFNVVMAKVAKHSVISHISTAVCLIIAAYVIYERNVIGTSDLWFIAFYICASCAGYLIVMLSLIGVDIIRNYLSKPV